VIFDEAEAEDKKQTDRMQEILNLGRASSAESGAKIVKGTATHQAHAFDIRSCFAFSSINTAVKHRADERRVTMLVLRPTRAESEKDAERSKVEYETLKQDIVTTLTSEFAAGLLARTLDNLPTLRANIDSFVSAGSVVLGSRAAADQIAPMLAGAFLLHSNKRISTAEALEWLRANDLSELSPTVATGDDEMRLFNYLMAHRLRVPTTTGIVDRTVGELILAGYAGHPDEWVNGVAPETAHGELRRFGIRIDVEGGFYVSTSADSIKRALADQPWASNWSRPLRMVPGADVVKNPIVFSTGVRTRAIWLPISLIDND
jgi:putative DNA primase/helicase